MTPALTIQILRGKLSKELMNLETARRSVKQEKKSLKEERERLSNLKEAQAVLQEVARGVQELAHQRISTLVTKCLQTVFGPSYELAVEFVKKRNKTEAIIYVCKDGHKLDPSDSSGGGICDLAAFSLRLACLSLQLPQGRKVLIMDEPFKWVSANHRTKIRLMLEMLSEELGMQFILSTHMKSLQTGTIIELE